MSSKLYVGNLSFKTSEEDLAEHFGAAGTVASVKIITDRETGRSRGFGFVEMSSPEEAQAAVDQFNGAEYLGRNLKVDIAKERDSRPPRRG
ncbi:MAG: RNA-binding protein [Deltaproteobacteria bacterium]|jgi:cold-inducible RNA-binding protein|nr:MAG: RNA-binding protein [Deltaproteobacteria bacterium]